MLTPQTNTPAARIADLEARLAEAEDTLRAIRAGEVDALFVTKPEGDQIFTLQGAEKTYRILVEEMSEGALLLAAEGTVLYANARFADLAGAALERIIGSSPEDCFAPADQPRLRALLAAAREGPVREEFYLAGGAASPRPVVVSLRSLHREWVEGLCVVVTDLSGRRAAEEALREANEKLELRVEQRTAQLTRANEHLLAQMKERKQAEELSRRNEAELSAIYDSTPLMLCLVNRQLGVERVNRTMAEFVRCNAPVAAGRYPGDLLGCVNALDDSRGCGFGALCGACALRLAAERTFETGEPCRQIEATLLLVRDGARRTLQISASSAVVRMGDQPRVLVCLEDITARKQLEAQFLHAQKMEAVGRLAGSVAHDFNNILAATMLHLELLQQTEGLAPQMADELLELIQGVLRARNLTRQLLLFSRRQVMQTRQEDLNDVVQELMKMLERLMGEDVEMVFRPAPHPLWVEADAGMLEQLVMNLCVNARDAMPRGGQLKLSLELATLDTEDVQGRAEARPGRFACFSAADTGCGMDEATLKRAFEPFFTTKDPGKGTGLGLATIHSIASQHHGWVEVESAVGQGTTFRVFLPVLQAPTAPRLQTSEDGTAGGAETILLVEDDEQVRRMVKMTLIKFGYEVLDAANGAEALRLWGHRRNEVSLLLTDMIMPGGMSGIDLARQLRELKPSLKVVMSSGYAADFFQPGGGLPLGVKFLAKPYERNSLARTVREALD